MSRFFCAFLLLGLMPLPAPPTDPRPRARDLGLAPGIYKPGPLNAITDVPGVRAGHVTLIEGDSYRVHESRREAAARRKKKP